jgi:hypothetical protein
MKDKIIEILKKEDYKIGGPFISPERYEDIANYINEIYKYAIIDICNEEYSSDEKVIDIARLFIKDYDPHEASKVKCDLCSIMWIAVRPKGINKLECPYCNNMVHFENI